MREQHRGPGGGTGDLSVRVCYGAVSVRDRQTGSGMAFRSGDLTDTSR